jgi:hypothetical protein
MALACLFVHDVAGHDCTHTLDDQAPRVSAQTAMPSDGQPESTLGSRGTGR